MQKQLFADVLQNRCFAIFTGKHLCGSLFLNVRRSATLLKVTFLLGCFSRYLNCTNGTKSSNASRILDNLNRYLLLRSMFTVVELKLIFHEKKSAHYLAKVYYSKEGF